MSEKLYHRKAGNICAVIVSMDGALEGAATARTEVQCFVRAGAKTSTVRFTSPSELALYLREPAAARVNAVYWDSGGHMADVLFPADWENFAKLAIPNVRGFLIGLAVAKDPILDTMQASSSASIKEQIADARRLATAIVEVIET